MLICWKRRLNYRIFLCIMNTRQILIVILFITDAPVHPVHKPTVVIIFFGCFLIIPQLLWLICHILEYTMLGACPHFFPRLFCQCHRKDGGEAKPAETLVLHIKAAIYHYHDNGKVFSSKSELKRDSCESGIESKVEGSDPHSITAIPSVRNGAKPAEVGSESPERSSKKVKKGSESPRKKKKSSKKKKEPTATELPDLTRVPSRPDITASHK